VYVSIETEARWRKVISRRSSSFLTFSTLFYGTLACDFCDLSEAEVQCVIATIFCRASRTHAISVTFPRGTLCHCDHILSSESQPVFCEQRTCEAYLFIYLYTVEPRIPHMIGGESRLPNKADQRPKRLRTFEKTCEYVLHTSI
jgi:hypothetical protein